MKLTIKRFGQAKDIQTKYGLKQKSALQAAEHGEEWLGYWVSPSTKNWKIGESIEVESVDAREYNGKKYYDIKLPKVDNRPAPQSSAQLSELLTKVGKLDYKIDRIINHLSGKDKLNETSAGTKIPDFSEVDIKEDDGLDQINPEDIPF